MSSVVLVLGPEALLAREAIEDCLGRHPDLEVSRFDGLSLSQGRRGGPARVLDELRTPTLLGGRRAAVVEDAGRLFDAESLRVWAEYAAAPQPGALLILRATSLDRRTKVAKALVAHAEVVECKAPPPARIAAWIQDRGRRSHELQVGHDAAQALRERIGEDLGLLDAALARLRQQIQPRKRLSVDDVTESTRDQRSPAVFEASSALEDRNLAQALDAVDSCFREGIRFPDKTVSDSAAVAPILLSQLHKRYLRLLRFHMAKRAGVPAEEAAKDAGVSPRAARFFLERARRHRLDQLRDRHRHFVAADASLKDTGADPRRTIEGLLLALLK